jgi:hypothetical protein
MKKSVSARKLMSMRRVLVGSAMGALTLLGAPLAAQSAPCVTAPISVYTAAGFSCQVGSETFSNISIIGTATGNASVTLTSVSPFISGNEFGLQLNFLEVAGPSPPAGASDIVWSYDVTSTVPLIDALLEVVGNTTGTGVLTVNEQLSNGVSLSLNDAGQATATFAPVTSLHVLKDKVDVSGVAGFSASSILVNAFSPVPGPIVGAGVPGLIVACGGLLALARRRRRQTI